MGGVQYVIYWYPYLKHIIEFWPWDWVDLISKIDEEVGERTKCHESAGKRQLVHFSNNEFCKCIGCIILEVIYEEKEDTIWLITTINNPGKAESQIDKYTCGNTDLIKVR